MPLGLLHILVMKKRKRQMKTRKNNDRGHLSRINIHPIVLQGNLIDQLTVVYKIVKPYTRAQSILK